MHFLEITTTTKAMPTPATSTKSNSYLFNSNLVYFMSWKNLGYFIFQATTGSEKNNNLSFPGIVRNFKLNGQ